MGRVPWKKYRNYLLNTIEYEARKVVLKSYPYRLYIDPLNACNLRCPLCPTGQGLMPSRGQMSLETFRQIFDMFREYVDWVALYNWGEPLLHPRIFEMVRHVAHHRVRTMISTHLNVPFSVDRAEEMIESGLSQLIVSLDGATPETYGRYRLGGDFDDVMRNLRTLAEIKRRKGSRWPEVVVQFIVFRHNEHEVGPMAALAGQVGGRLSVVPATCDMGAVAEMSPQEAVARHGDWLPTAPRYRRYDRAGNWVYTTEACESLWNTAVFRWDGAVFPCCLPYKDEHRVGNIHENEFESLWNGPAYQKGRSLFGKASARRAAGPVVCDRCYEVKGWNVQNLPGRTARDMIQALGSAVVRQMVKIGVR